MNAKYIPVGTKLKVEAAKGEFIHKLRSGKAGKAIFEVMGYCRYNKAYELINVLDISADSYLKKGKEVIIAEY